MGHGLFTTDDIDSRILYKEFQQGVEVYNDQEWAIISKFIRKTTKETVKSWERNMEFVRSSEGFLETWRKIGSRSVDLPLLDYALGFGFTKQAIQDSNANEVKETQKSALRADQRLLAKIFFDAILAPGSNEGFWDGNMTVAPAAHKGNTFQTTHTHYVTSGSATPTLANISRLKRLIREHGYMGKLFMFLNSSTVEDLENLAGWTTAMTPVSVIDLIAREGFEAIKVFQGLTWITDDWVPDGYLVAVEGQIKPVTMREPLQPAGRGLKLYEGPYSDMPLREAYYEHRLGMEVCHRGAGAAIQITEGASWTNASYDFQA